MNKQAMIDLKSRLYKAASTILEKKAAAGKALATLAGGAALGAGGYALATKDTKDDKNKDPEVDKTKPKKKSIKPTARNIEEAKHRTYYSRSGRTIPRSEAGYPFKNNK